MKFGKAENAGEYEDCRIETFRILRVVRGWKCDVAIDQRVKRPDEMFRRETAGAVRWLLRLWVVPVDSSIRGNADEGGLWDERRGWGPSVV
jgi:hypothetical protein